MRILITRTDRIGDCVLSTPVIKAVRETFPEAYIAFCVEKPALQTVAKNPFLDEVIISDKRGAHKSITGMARFITGLAGKKIDIAIILHPTQRINLACFLAGIPKRVGYDRKWGRLLTVRIPHAKEKGLKHEMEYTLDVIRALGVQPKDKTLYFPLDSEDEKSADNIFSVNGLAKGEKIIAIHPGASCPSKRWPPEKFSGVCDSLKDRFPHTIVIVGEKSCSEYARSIKKMSKARIVDLTGKTDVSTLAAILKRAALFISNDSGPVHISTAVGTPVISIFGREEEVSWCS